MYNSQQQNYNSYYPQMPNYTQQLPSYRQNAPVGLKGRPVSSFDEVRAQAIDFDGSIFYFPDLANKKIYTKQINMDGTASLSIYELKENPTENFNQQLSSESFITRKEFEDTIQSLKQLLVQQHKDEVKAF